LVDNGRLLYLGIAVAASAALMFLPAAQQPRKQPLPTLAQVWPAAQRGTIPADLPDRTAYEPGLYLDAKNSVGTAPSPDGKFLRLVIRLAGGGIRELRRIPMNRNPSFESLTAAAGAVFWAESTDGGQQLWTADLRAGRPARRLTADTGDARFYQSQYDLVIAQGRVHWVAAAPQTGTAPATEIRSVALAGGRVDVRTVPGTWALSGWPWIVDGWANTAGTGLLRDLMTGRERAVPLTRRGVTACSPTWCQAVSIDDDGYQQIEIARPDGQDRRRVGQRGATTVIADVAVLDRFEVFAQITGESTLTGRNQLLVYDIATHRTVAISPEGGSVAYRDGVLWWSTGNQDSFLRHSLDLRTI
jgi:hypothetical protein